jgi:hypothetical protein
LPLIQIELANNVCRESAPENLCIFEIGVPDELQDLADRSQTFSAPTCLSHQVGIAIAGFDLAAPQVRRLHRFLIIVLNGLLCYFHQLTCAQFSAGHIVMWRCLALSTFILFSFTLSTSMTVTLN